MASEYTDQKHVPLIHEDEGVDHSNPHVPHEEPRKRSTFSNQTRALFYKSAGIQWSQKGTNCCQVLTPLVCLLFVFLIKKLAESQINNGISTTASSFPYLLNVPIWDIMHETGLKNLPFDVDTCVQWYGYQYGPNIDQAAKDYIGTNNGTNSSTGTFLNLTYQTKCPNDTQMMPYFNSSFGGLTLDQYLYNETVYLNSLDIKNQVPGAIHVLPDGTVTFFEAGPTKMNVSLQINDYKIQEYHRTNGVTQLRINGSKVSTVASGQLQLMDMLSRTYLRTQNSSFWLVTGLQSMPSLTGESDIVMGIISIIGGSLYPFALSILLPVYMFNLVLEKEERLQEMMKMNGMQMKYYWLVNYTFFLALYLIAVGLFYLFGVLVLQISFFTSTNFGIMCITLLGWGLSQTSLAIFFQNFLKKARYATILGYLLAIWTVIVALTLNYAVYPSPATLPVGYRFYPAFSFCRILYVLANNCGSGSCASSFSDLTSEVNECLIFLYLGAVVFFLVGVYLNEVLPQEYGVPRHPLFIFNSCRRRREDGFVAVSDSNQEGHTNALEAELDGEDDDCRDERNAVMNAENPRQFPLLINNIRKIYAGPEKKVAVKSFCLGVRPGETFGLLGPNGAGKTTLISMLTGLYPPTAGEAMVAGYAIKDEIDNVHLNMGVCPQFDLLWPELTVNDHLLFYARMRGVPVNEEKERVSRAMDEVYLANFKDFKTRQLSGGMKRRLSVAIALVGDPKVVFLDEPTTGLDPENRRQLWDILTESRGKRSMVLTTHSMEEADVLCNRIGIICKGVLRCIGPQVRLKTLYGGGYHLSINCHKGAKLGRRISLRNSLPQEESKEDVPIRKISLDPKAAHQAHQKVIEFIQQLLPGTEVRSSFNGTFEFKVPLNNLQISTLIDKLESRKDEFAISDWGLSQSSLEDVFLEIVSAAEKNS